MWPLMQTPNRASLSIIGLYNWDDDIFENMSYPSGFTTTDKELTIDNILAECGELEIMYPDWEFMHKAIEYWSLKELPTWQHIYDMGQLEYNPIENYDRHEQEVEQEAGTDGRQRLTQSSSEGKGLNQTNNVNKVAGINTDNMSDQSSTAGNNVTDTKGSGTLQEVDAGSSSQNRNRSSHIHGNIGVTTVAQMMEGELATYPKINIINYIVQAFKERFCLMVY